MQTIKDLLSKYKIHVAIVGGALVIGTAYATCTVEPVLSEPAVEEAEPEAATEEATETTSSAPATEGSNSEENPSTENN